MEDNRITIFGKNLRELRRLKQISQQTLADELGVSKATISTYENEKDVSIPSASLQLITQISSYFQVKIDDILFKDFSNPDSYEINHITPGEEITPFKNIRYSKYINNEYYIYFYNTHAQHKGEIKKLNLIIRENTDTKTYDIYIYEEKNRINNSKYNGKFVLTHDYFYLYLKGIEHSERALFIFKAPNNSVAKKYIGGIGVASSISCGNEKGPCMQKILLLSTEIDNLGEPSERLLSSLKLSDDELIKIAKEDDHYIYKCIKLIDEKK